jgi:hypothetical protein
MLLLGFGCLNLLLWLAKAPIPHVRYLYPGIPMMWLAAGLAALTSLRRLTYRSSIGVCHLCIVLVSAASLPASLWYLASGESLTGVYQVIRQASFVAPREPFQAFRHQRNTADFVRALPPDSRLLSFFPQAAYPITYLSWRPIHSVGDDWTRPGPKYLLIVPGERTIRRFPEPSVLWLNEFASRLFESGDFAVYAVRDDAPQPKT